MSNDKYVFETEVEAEKHNYSDERSFTDEVLKYVQHVECRSLMN